MAITFRSDPFRSICHVGSQFGRFPSSYLFLDMCLPLHFSLLHNASSISLYRSPFFYPTNPRIHV